MSKKKTKRKQDPDKMLKDLVNKSVIVKTISEICELWPESLSKAFYLNGDKSQLYFLIDRPKYMKNKKVRSIMPCYKIIEGYPVLRTELNYMIEDEITPIPLSEFKNQVMGMFKALTEKKDQTEQDIVIIQSYETALGFKI